MTFTIYTNDRGMKGGINLYSAWRTIEADNRIAANHVAKQLAVDLPYLGTYAGGPVVIPTHVAEQNGDDRHWLLKHVGA